MSDESPPQSNQATTVPYERFQRVNDEAANAKLQVAELTKKIAELQPLIGQVADYQAALAQKTEEADIFRVGITDPEAITVARALHASLPSEGRPTLPAWLGALRESPSTAPRALTPYFAAPAAAPPAVGSPVATQLAGAVPASAGATPAIPAGAKITAERLQAASGTPEWKATFNAWKLQNGQKVTA